MRKSCIAWTLGTVLLFAASGVQAMMIRALPSVERIAPGDSVAVDLVIPEIESSTIGTFDIDIHFDAKVLRLDDVRFGVSLGDAEAGEAEWVFDTGTDGRIGLYALSLLEVSGSGCDFCSPPYLEDLQSDTFVLVSLSFIGASLGTGTIVPTVNALGDGKGRDILSEAEVQSANVRVIRETSTPLSEPPILALLHLSIVGMAFGLRRSISLRVDQ